MTYNMDPCNNSDFNTTRELRPAMSREIEVINARDLTYDAFLCNYLRKNRPVVIDEAVTSWPALHKWSPQYFKDALGPESVQVSYSKRMSMTEFVDSVLASSEDHPGPYLYRSFLHEHLPTLLQDLIPQNIYGFPARYASPLMPKKWKRPDGYLKLLMGGPGSKFPVMHFDLEHAHAQITEIYGEKEYYIFSPDDTPFLYPSPVQPNLSQIDQPHRPDLQRFPLFLKTTPYHTILKPGQMIFIPMAWWHAARPISISISVCTNILERSNWTGFVRDVCSSPQDNTLKRLLKRMYFETSGLIMRLMEDLQTSMPSLAHTLMLPAKLAPATSGSMPDPSRAPIHFEIPAD